MEALLEHHEWVVILLMLVESWYWIWRIRRIRKQYESVQQLTRLEREIIVDALETYSQVIAKAPHAFRYPLDEIADFLKGVDNLKDRINV